MRASTIVVLGTVLLHLGCSDAPHSNAAPPAAARPVPAAPAPPVAGPYSSVAEITARVDSIDALDKNKGQLEVYAIVPGKKHLVPVKDSTSWPEDIEASVNILRDGAGHMLLHREMPTSESGDWYEERTHYFAPDGRTILYDFKINGFNECGLLREHRRFFYDSAFVLLKRDSSYTDKDDKPIDPSNCYRRGDHPEPAKRRSADFPGGP